MKDELGAGRMRVPPKTTPRARDGRQSSWVAWGIGTLLSVFLGLRIFQVVGIQGPPRWFLLAAGVSIVFAILVWKVKASTGPGAVMGGAVCLKISMVCETQPWTRSAIPELIALFLMTFLATRFGRRRKEATGAIEERERRGRRAAQVAANIGLAGLAAGTEISFMIACLAVLAEATADTVSSEVGQVAGGSTFLITDLRRVPPGTDGAVSLAGTAFGIAAAGVIAGLGVGFGAVDGPAGLLVFFAGCAGLVFDSVLGATLERRGWLGNDLVNLFSTGFAALVGLELARYLAPPLAFW